MTRTLLHLAVCGALTLGAIAPSAADPLGLQSPLTLAQAVDRVLQAGFDVRTAVQAAQLAQADAATARAPLRPQLAISATARNDNIPQLGMPIASQAYGGLSASVPLFTPSTGPSARASALSALAAATSVDTARNDAFLAAVQAYRRAQLALAVYQTREANVRDQQDHLATTQARVRAGTLPRYVVARDQAGLAVAQQSQEDAAAERDEAANDLAAILDISVATPPQIATPLDVTPFNGTLDHYLTRALAQRPSIIAARQRVDAAQRSIASARGAYLPSATLSAASYNGISSPNLGRSGGQVLLVASLPIADGGLRAAAEERARATLSDAQISYEQTRLGTERDVRNAWRELQAARTNLGTAQAAARDAQVTLRIALMRAAAGKGIDLEVLDALAVSASARETVVRSIARYDDAVALAHHAAGDLSL
ncbi:MAG: TolC family protein [Candidatus Eremiobacteraeota bacterium]|nr:TolC family protein [Candidatus Eremiobacteraeota bacterium]